MTYTGRNRLQVGAGRREKKKEKTHVAYLGRNFIFKWFKFVFGCVEGGGGTPGIGFVSWHSAAEAAKPPFLRRPEHKYELRFALFSDE